MNDFGIFKSPYGRLHPESPWFDLVEWRRRYSAVSRKSLNEESGKDRTDSGLPGEQLKGLESTTLIGRSNRTERVLLRERERERDLAPFDDFGSCLSVLPNSYISSLLNAKRRK